MKKKTFKICALALAGLLFVSSLSSCSKDSTLDNELKDPSDTKLDFSTLVGDYSVDVANYFNSSVLTNKTNNVTNDKISVIVEMAGDTESDYYLKNTRKYASVGEFSDSKSGIALNNKLVRSQAALAKCLLDEGLISSVKSNYTVLMNGFSAETTSNKLKEIRNYPGVSSVTVCASYALPETVEVKHEEVTSKDVGNDIACDSATGIATNDTEYKGEGMVVAVLDSGLDYTHPAFKKEVPLANQTLTKEIVAEKVAVSTAKAAYEAGHAGNTIGVDDVYISTKIPFAYDYADNDADVLPAESDHGTHVSGIILGYDENVKVGYDENLKRLTDTNYQKLDNLTDKEKESEIKHTVTGFSGVAPEAQLVSMKVFPDEEEHAQNDIIYKALEDAVLLNVDVINESLGSICGFSEDAELDKEYGEINRKTNIISRRIQELGISLVASAGNSYYQQYQATDGSNLVISPESHTVGSPGSYTTSFTIASVERKKVQYIEVGNTQFTFSQASDNDNNDYDFIKMVFEKYNKNNGTNYNYLTDTLEVGFAVIPNLGGEEDFKEYKKIHGEDSLANKICLVKRGITTFESKIGNAKANGALGCIVYNNVSGIIRMTCGDSLTMPAASITNNIGVLLEEMGEGTLKLNYNNFFGPFMSDFSSLGCNPDLTLKPEITSCGGEVLSSVIGGGYEEFSGTSMSAPNISGIMLAVKQYVKANFQKLTGIDPSTLTATQLKKKICEVSQQLVMSTALLADDERGNIYSPRKQGAGIASVDNCINTKAFLHVGDSDKAKLEIKDDKQKTGEYVLTFNIRNTSDEALTYSVNDLAFTETASHNGETVENTSHKLNNTKTVTGKNGVTVTGDKITIAPNSDGEITVTLKLSAEDKKYIDSTFPNGMYVEGFIRLVPENQSTGVELGIPFLGFYGDWLQAPVWDKTYYDVQSKDYYDEDVKPIDREHAALNEVTPYGHYGDFYMIPLGGYVYDMDKTKGYEQILATEDKAAISLYEYAIDNFYLVRGGILRSPKSITTTITDASTGEVLFEQTDYQVRKDTFYSNSGAILSGTIEYNWSALKSNIPNNTKCIITLKANLDYEGGDQMEENGIMSFSFYVDYEAPTLQDVQYIKIFDSYTGKYRYYLDATIYDNRYAMSIMPAIIEVNPDKTSSSQGKLTMLGDNIPLYQEEAGTTTKTRIEITKYIDSVLNSLTPDSIYLYVDDYAMNYTLYKIPLNGAQCKDLTFTQTEIVISENEVVDLADYTTLDNSMLEGFTWTTNAPKVASVSHGQIFGKSRGIATAYGTTSYGTKVSVKIKVLGSQDEGYVKFDEPTPNEISINSYTTLLTFDDDGYRSHISDVGETNYKMNNIIKLYVGEKIQLNTIIGPWYTDQSNCSIEWKINTDVCEIDENGVLEATFAGSSSIYCYLYVDGKKTKAKDSFKVEVEDSLVTSGSALMAYKGTEEVVVVPGSRNIKYIYMYAFSLYKYGLDSKGDFIQVEIGNPYIKEVFLPADIETIYNYAFAKCTALETINIPDKVTEIYQGAFEGDKNLKTVSIGDNSKCIKILYNAFNGCSSLEAINLKNVVTIGSNAFKGCTSLKEVDLTNMKYYSSYAFANCTSLETITLSPTTAIGQYMFTNTGVKELVLDQAYISEGAFANCKNLTKVTFTNPNVVIGKNAFKGCTKLSEVSFADGGNISIASGAFNGTAIQTLNIPNSTVTIGDSVFQGSSLATLNLAANATIVLNGMSFNGAKSLNTITAAGSSKYTVTNNVLMEGTTIVLVPANLTTVTLPVNATVIGTGALAGSLATDITLPATIKTIKPYAFSNSSIKTVDFNGATNVAIEEYAFYKATKLTTLTSLNTSTIKPYAFAESALTTISFAANATVESYAFSTVKSLEKVTFAGDATIKDHAFYKAFYRNGGIVEFASSSNIIIGDYAFAESNIKSIDLAKATTIGAHAFENASKLIAIDLTNATTIGDYAFAGCTTAASVTLGASITKLPSYVFNGCSSVTTIALNNVSEIGEFAFAKATKLATIDLTNVTKIGKQAFDATAITTANLANIEDLGEFAFIGCSSLATVTLPASLVELPNGAFSRCSSLATINLENVKVVGAYAFELDAKLANINLSNVVEIKDSAFKECSSLLSLALPKCEKIGILSLYGTSIASISMPVMKSIESFALASTRLETVDLPETITYIGTGAFQNSLQIKKFTSKGNDSAKTASFMIDNGVLYTVKGNKYILEVYPALKEAEEYTVAEGTFRIEEYAFYKNTSLKKVTLPTTLTVIGDSAFYATTNLTTYVFLGMKAPELEGYYSSSLINYINNLKEFPAGLADMYKNSYWEVSYFYANFYEYLGLNKDLKLLAIVSDDAVGYDNFIFHHFFTYMRPSAEVSYKVHFNTNGGDDISSQRVAEGGKVTMPGVPEKKGYEFVKWIKEDGTDFDFNAPLTGDFDSITLKAVYKLASDTPSVDPEDPTNPDDPQPQPQKPTKNNNGVIIGVSVGGGVLVLAGIGAALFFILRKKKNS